MCLSDQIDSRVLAISGLLFRYNGRRFAVFNSTKNNCLNFLRWSLLVNIKHDDWALSFHITRITITLDTIDAQVYFLDRIFQMRFERRPFFNRRKKHATIRSWMPCKFLQIRFELFHWTTYRSNDTFCTTILLYLKEKTSKYLNER